MGRVARLVGLGFLMTMAMTGCATVPARRGPDHTPLGPGVASFYADTLAGRRTANGERYDPHKLTCAHRTLPFGTRVEVTARKSHASAVCRVNDRGPYVPSRVIDLSHAMARALNADPGGLLEVELRLAD